VNRRDAKVDVIRVCRWLSQRALVAADDGSVSVRISAHRLLITPQGQNMERLQPDELALIDLKRRRPTNHRRPSRSLNLHLAVYACREDIRALILSQPPAATAFAVAGIPLVQPAIPEMVLNVGAVPMAPYGTPYTDLAIQTITPLVENHDAVLLKNRGLLVLGTDLSDAVDTLERTEKAASVLLGAKALGQIDLLSGSQVQELMELRTHLALRGR
jgi:L-fuculose-phosphate aldolase